MTVGGRARRLCVVPVLVLTGLVAVLPGDASAQTTPPPPGLPGDVDGDKVLDDLDAQLAATPAGEPVPVIVQTTQPATPLVLLFHQLAAGGFDVEHVYVNVHGYAASMTPAQVAVVATFSNVLQVERDGLASATLETARTGFGATHAVSDFGVTGNADGSSTSYSKNDVVIAVVDTGIDVRHRDLDGGKVIGFHDVLGDLPDCPTPPPSGAYDDHTTDGGGHGTHVASIAAGSGDATRTRRGVAPGAALVGVKVLDCRGWGSFSDIAAGADWVVSNRSSYGIEVMNLSIGGAGDTSGTDITSKLLNVATANGIAVTVAAGNEGPRSRSLTLPGGAKWALTVGAMSDPGDTENGAPPGFALAAFSGRGPTKDGRVKPDVVGPGVDVRAAARGTATGYSLKNGTSMAAPFVAGVAALLRDAGVPAPSGTVCTDSSNPDCYDGVVDASMRNGVKSRIVSTAVDWGAPGKDSDYGAGRLDAHAAVRAALGESGRGPSVPPHHAVGGTLSGTGDVDQWTLRVPSTTWPIAATLVMQGAGTSPNLDLRLRTPTGEVTVASTSLRNEQVGIRPLCAGTYVLRVESRSGGGSYRLDLSGPSDIGSGTPSTCPTASSRPAPPPTTDGYVLLDDRGGLFSFGDAPFLGSVPGLQQADPDVRAGRVVGAFPTHGGAGYVAYDEEGRVFPFGRARNLGSVYDRVQAGQLGATRVVVAFPTHDGEGYVLVDETGGVHTFGAAPYLGSVTDLRATMPIGAARIVTGFAVDGGSGYVLIDDIGGLFAFGTARFLGSVPALRNSGVPIGPARVISGFSVDGGNGYVMIDDVGGLFAFGTAGFLGSVPALRDAGIPIGPAVVVGGFSVDGGNGYVMIDDVGGLFAFGTARFLGSVPALRGAGVPIGPAVVVGGFAA